MASKLDLLEKRLSRLKGSSSAPAPKEVNPAAGKELTLLTVVDHVHELANELWNDSQIFGPHQSPEESPTKSLPPGLSPEDLVKKSPSPNFTSTPKKSSHRSNNNASVESAEVDAERRKRLDKIATLYCDSLDNNLCLNILAEVELWLQLLTENYDSSLSSAFAPKDHIFSTVASRVYFVSKVLEAQMTNVLLYIDPQVCHSLCKNFPLRIPKLIRKELEKIVGLQQDTSQKIQDILNQSDSSSSGSKAAIVPKDDRVTFQQETDGRSNFLNQNDFHAFCKQRDIFYSVKDSWIQNNSSSGSNQQFTKSYQQQPQSPTQAFTSNSNNNNNKRLGSNKSSSHPHQSTPSDNSTLKVKQLVQLNASPTNLSRLAALCLSQYLLDCASFKDYGMIPVVANENLRQIFQSNPSKFKQLENRFPKKETTNDPLTFFKYFVELASWSEFNQHLIDRCILELQEINVSILRQEVQSPKEIVDDLNKSRLVAQILGYLYFRPYRSQTSKKSNSIEFETYMQRQIQLRSYQSPPLNLEETLQKSFSSKTLVLTLPWIIEFLSQADTVTFQLPSYRKVLSLISLLYRSVLAVSQGSAPKYGGLCKSNQAFLRFYCHHLFQRSDFPVNLIFQEQNLEDLTLLLSNNGEDSSDKFEESDEDIEFDSYCLLGDTLNSILFERQMTEMKNILGSARKKPQQQGGNKANSVNVLPVKHIRPVSLNLSKQPKLEEDQSQAQLQQQLESSFFHNHPPSVKRTVEFISDRVASNFVKELRTKLYPEFRDECIAQGISGEEASSSCQERALKVFKDIHLVKGSEAVQLLIGETSLSEGALQACKSIVARRSLEKVCNWIETHFSKDLFPEVVNSSSPSTSLNNSLSTPKKAGLLSPFNRSVSSPMNLLSLQQQQQSPLLNRTLSPLKSPLKGITPQIQPKFQALVTLQQTLQKIYKFRMEAKDVAELSAILRPSVLGNAPLALHSTIDIVLAFLTFCPQDFSPELESQFVEYWSSVWKSSHVKILCPRNIFLFEQSSSPELTWNKVSCLVSRLIKLNVIDLKDMEEQCLGFLRHDWPPGVLTRISEFSRRVSGSTSVKSEESEVIDWIAWACSDDVQFD